MPPTPSRNIRIPDDLWNIAQIKAAEQYTTVSAVIVQLLAGWVDSPHLAPAGKVAGGVCFRAQCGHRLAHHREHPAWVAAHPGAEPDTGCTMLGCECRAAVASTS